MDDVTDEAAAGSALPSGHPRGRFCTPTRRRNVCRLLSIGTFVATVYYLVALIAIVGHALQATDSGRSPSGVIGLGLRALSTSSAVTDGGDGHLDIYLKARNNLLTSLVFHKLDVDVHAVGISSKLLDPTSGDVSAAVIMTAASDPMVWVSGGGGPDGLVPPECLTASAASCAPPAVRTTIRPHATQAWLQSVVGLISGMSISPGYASSIDRSSIADLRVTGSLAVTPLALAPFTIAVSASARVKMSNALRYTGSAATGGTGRWSFTSFLNSSGVALTSSSQYGVYADVAAAVGASTLALRLPLDLTGDLLARMGSGGSGSSTSSSDPFTSQEVVDVPDTSGNAAAGCCCGGSRANSSRSGSGRRMAAELLAGEHHPASAYSSSSTAAARMRRSDTPRRLQSSSPSSSGIGADEAAVLAEYPASPPYTATYGLAKANLTGVLHPNETSFGILFCRGTEDLITSPTDILLYRDIAAAWDAAAAAAAASSGGSSAGLLHTVRPGSTIIGDRGQAQNTDGGTDTTDTSSAYAEQAGQRYQSAAERALRPASYRRADLCSQQPSGDAASIAATDGVFGVTRQPLRLAGVAGRQGYPSIYSAVQPSSGGRPGGALPSFATVSIASDPFLDVLGGEVRVASGQVPDARRMVRELIMGEDGSAAGSSGAAPGSPRVDRPVSPSGQALLWRCHPQQVPLGVVAASEHPLAGIFDGLFTCLLPPWLDAMTGAEGGVSQDFNTSDLVVRQADVDAGDPAAVAALARGGVVLTSDMSTVYVPPVGPKLNSHCTGAGNEAASVVTSSTGLSGWTGGLGANHTYALWSAVGGNGRRDAGDGSSWLSLYTGNGSAVGVSSDPPWLYIRASLGDGGASGVGLGGIDSGSSASYGKQQTLDVTTSSVSSCSAVAQQQRRLHGVEGPASKPARSPRRMSARRRRKSDEMTSAEVVGRRLKAKRALQTSEAAVQEDPNGGLLASLVSWYNGQVVVDAHEDMTWDTSLPPYRGRMAAADGEAVITAGLSLAQKKARASDPCAQLINHDVAIMGSCCLNSTPATGATSSSGGGGSAFNQPHMSEGRRTLALSGTARLAAGTLRSVLFRSTGDVQPFIFPTLLLHHVNQTAVTTSDASSSSGRDTSITRGSVTTGVAAVIRACAAAIPNIDLNGYPSQQYGQVKGAWYAGGDEYRLRVKVVMSIVDEGMVWGSGRRTTRTSGAGTASDASSSARGVFDLFFNGATRQGIDSITLDDAAANLLRDIIEQRISSSASSLSTGTSSSTAPVLSIDADTNSISPAVPLPDSPAESNDPLLGNYTDLLAGINWRLTMTSYPAALNALQSRCRALGSGASALSASTPSLQCFDKPLAAAVIASGGSAAASPFNPVGASPVQPLPDPMLWRLLSGLSFDLRQPTIRDTAAFALGGDRLWPGQLQGLAALLAETAQPSGDTSGGDDVDRSRLDEVAILMGTADSLPHAFPFDGFTAGDFNISSGSAAMASHLNITTQSSAASLSNSTGLRTGIGMVVADLMTFHPATELGSVATSVQSWPRSMISDAQADAIDAASTTSASVNGSNASAWYGWQCPVTALCTGGSTGEAQPSTPPAYYSSTNVRGAAPGCTYQASRQTCADWASAVSGAANDTSSAAAAAGSNLTTSTSSACAAMMAAACSEWSYPCTQITGTRMQDIPVAYLHLPEVDLGQVRASLQVAVGQGSGCHANDANGDGDAADHDVAVGADGECDPMHASSWAIDQYSQHAAGLLLSLTKSSTLGWQAVRADLSLSFCPLDTVGSFQPGLPTDTVNVRPLPVARATLIAALLTRSRLLTRAVATHRQLDVPLPIRLHPASPVSAHHMAVTSVDDTVPLPVAALDPGVTGLPNAAVPTTPLSQPSSLTLHHLWLHPATGQLHLGVLLVNTLPVQLTVPWLLNTTLTGLLKVSTAPPLASSSTRYVPVTIRPATVCSPTAGSSSSPSSSSSPLATLSPTAPIDVIRYGLAHDVSGGGGGSGTSDASTVAFNTSILPGEGCGLVSSSVYGGISISSLAAAVGVPPATLQHGLTIGWMAHVSIPVDVDTAGLAVSLGAVLGAAADATSVDVSPSSSVLATSLMAALTTSLLGNKGMSAAGWPLTASVNTSTGSVTTINATALWQPSLLLPTASSSSTTSPAAVPIPVSGSTLSAAGGAAHVVHLSCGVVGVQLGSLPVTMVKMVPVPRRRNTNNSSTALGLGLGLLPAAYAYTPTAATAASGGGADSNSSTSNTTCPFLLSNGTCTCKASPSAPSTVTSTVTYGHEEAASFGVDIDYLTIDYTPATGIYMLFLVLANIASCCFCWKVEGCFCKRTTTIIRNEDGSVTRVISAAAPCCTCMRTHGRSLPVPNSDLESSARLLGVAPPINNSRRRNSIGLYSSHDTIRSEKAMVVASEAASGVIDDSPISATAEVHIVDGDDDAGSGRSPIHSRRSTPVSIA